MRGWTMDTTTSEVTKLDRLPTEEPYRGDFKAKRVRDYSMGSIVDLIRSVETAEQLEEVRQLVLELKREGKLSRKTMRKIDKAGQAKASWLNQQTILRPNGGIVVPRHSDKLIVTP